MADDLKFHRGKAIQQTKANITLKSRKLVRFQVLAKLLKQEIKFLKKKLTVYEQLSRDGSYSCPQEPKKKQNNNSGDADLGLC